MSREAAIGRIDQILQQIADPGVVLVRRHARRREPSRSSIAPASASLAASSERSRRTRTRSRENRNEGPLMGLVIDRRRENFSDERSSAR